MLCKLSIASGGATGVEGSDKRELKPSLKASIYVMLLCLAESSLRAPYFCPTL
jgi:hypothetical protein